MRRFLLMLGTVILAACASAQWDGGGSMQAKGKDIRGEEVSYEAGGVKLQGYIAYDANQKGQRPGVVVVHEWWGHNDYARKRARMLAEMGYTALAVDMYGNGKQASHPEDAQKFMMEVMGNLKTAQARFEAGQAILQSHDTTDPKKTAAIGYCMGGAIVLNMARVGVVLKGVASFHGSYGTETPAKPGVVKARVLVCHGADDSFSSPEDIKAFKKEMADADVELKFIAYPGAVHAFTNPKATEAGKKFGLPLAYNEDADKKSWAELKTFLAEVFRD